MKTNDGNMIEKADCKSQVAFASQQRFWLMVAALWLQVVVLIFVFMQFKQHVHTPVSDWMSKIMHLFGE